jgi:hypothetical protein
MPFQKFIDCCHHPEEVTTEGADTIFNNNLLQISKHFYCSFFKPALPEFSWALANAPIEHGGLNFYDPVLDDLPTSYNLSFEYFVMKCWVYLFKYTLLQNSNPSNLCLLL